LAADELVSKIASFGNESIDGLMWSEGSSLRGEAGRVSLVISSRGDGQDSKESYKRDGGEVGRALS